VEDRGEAASHAGGLAATVLVAAAAAVGRAGEPAPVGEVEVAGPPRDPPAGTLAFWLACDLGHVGSCMAPSVNLVSRRWAEGWLLGGDEVGGQQKQSPKGEYRREDKYLSIKILRVP
jgi:hypothetical protein